MAVVKENEERTLEDLVEDDGFEDLTDFDDEPVEQEEPEVDPEPKEEAEAEAEDAPKSDDDQRAEVEEEAVVDESDDDQSDDDASDDDDVDDDDSLREQNAALLKHIESLSGQLVKGTLNPPAMKQVEDAKSDATPTTPAEVMNFLENTSIDDLLEDPSKFNAVLNQVAQTSQQAVVQGAVQQVLRSVPELVMGYITRHSTMNRMVDDFYRENPDLADVKQTVAAVANDVHSKNPDLGVEEVFKQSAEATRKLLGLKKQAQKAAQRQPKKPAFAKAGSARKAAPPVDPIQREINDLLSGDF